MILNRRRYVTSGQPVLHAQNARDVGLSSFTISVPSRPDRTASALAVLGDLSGVHSAMPAFPITPRNTEVPS
jgi:hypothetical protein